MLIFLTLIPSIYSKIISESIFPQPTSGAGAFIDADSNFRTFSGRFGPNSFNEGMHDFIGDTQNNAQSYSKSKFPESRYLYSSFYSSNFTAFYVFGGLGKSGIQGDMWKYSNNDYSWKKIFDYGGIPARFSASSVSVFSDSEVAKFYILGGIDFDSVGLSDFYEISLNQNSLVYSVKKLPDISPCFSSGLAGSQTLYENGKIYLFSGRFTDFKGDSTYYTGLCEYDLGLGTWKNYSMLNPLVRSYQGGGLIFNNTIYYLLGKNDEEFIDGGYMLDLLNVSQGWVKMGQIKESIYRSNFGSYVDGSSLYTIGGIDQNNYILGFTIIDIKNNSIEANEYSYRFDPTPRIKATAVQISDQLILFGGRNKNVFYNELWSMQKDPKSDIFYSAMFTASGTYPTPRSNHAAASLGNFMIIVGGLDQNFNYLSDSWVLKKSDLEFSWSMIQIPSDQFAPGPVADTCIKIFFPFFIYVGGRSSDSMTNEIIMFDFSENKYTSIAPPDGFEPVSKHGCYGEINEGFSIDFYVFFGIKSLNEDPSNLISVLTIFYNKTAVLKSSVRIPQVSPRADFIYAVINRTLFIGGGEASHINSFLDIWAIDLNTFEASYLESFKKSFYSSAFLYFQNFLFVFSGYRGNGDTVNQNPSNDMLYIKLDNKESRPAFIGYVPDPLDPYKKTSACSSGTYKGPDDQTCQLCPKGTYSKYQAATHISQCLPCPNNTYNNLTGQSSCTLCQSSEICLPGTVTPVKYKSDFRGVQPTQISSEVSYLFFYILISASVFFFIIFTVLWLKLINLRIFWAVNEIYAEKHLEEPIILDPEEVPEEDKEKHSYIGGFFTWVAVVVFLTGVAYYLYGYLNNNIYEVTGLVHTNTLQTNEFSNVPINISLILQSLRGDVNETCLDMKTLISPSQGIQYFPSTFKNSFNSTTNECKYEFQITKSNEIDMMDWISFQLLCVSCYTSDIVVGVSTDAAYHGELSSLYQSYYSDPGYVLTGYKPTVFSVELSPSLFEDATSSNGSSKYYGYRAFQNLKIDKGSLSDMVSIYLNVGINITLNFFISEVAVYSSRNFVIDKFGYFGVAAGGISGMIGVLGVAMKVYEYFFFKYKFRNNKKLSKYHAELERKIKARAEKEVKSGQTDDIRPDSQNEIDQNSNEQVSYWA